MITRRSFVRQTALATATLFFPIIATAQTALTYPPAPVPVDQVAATMKVPDGFKVTLFAGEPDVVQPIAFTFDDRGRMWVAECLSYPKWTKDGTGHDRIIILEDTDGDGVHDKRTVFAENLANLSGLEYGFGGVFICSLPTLKFIPDRDGDDVPDGPAETLLDGWDENCRHNVFNGLAWGPDGWLYGLNGILSRSSVGPPGAQPEKRKYMDCGVWRYHPTRRDFEPVAYGTTNPWGLDWDDYGEMFITNCVIKHLFHVVPGGHYERMFGADPNPHVYGLMQSCADHIHWAGGHWTDSRGAVGAHSDAGGGHAHSGCSVYLGDNFPDEYRNNVFMCNIHGNRLNRDRLERHGSGYVAHHEKDFLFANDPWHRGLVVKYGPDGGLYVADWCDTGECHNYDVADVTNGRIVRVKYEGPLARSASEEGKQRNPSPPTPLPQGERGAKPFDLQKLPDAELVALQLHRNDWWVRHARRVLQERAASKTLRPDTADLLRKMFADQHDATRVLRALWALSALGAINETDLFAALVDADEHVRAWGVTLTGEIAQPSALIYHWLRKRVDDGAPIVRLKLASVAQKLELGNGLAKSLSDDETNADDPQLYWMIWYALVHTGAANEMDLHAIPIVQRLSARHSLLTADSKAALSDRIQSWLTRSLQWQAELNRNPFNDDKVLPYFHAQLGDVLQGLLEALEGTRDLPPPDDWSRTYRLLAKSDSADVQRSATKLAVLFGDEAVIAQLREILSDQKADLAKRRRALDLLIGRRTSDLIPTLLTLLDTPQLRSEGLRGLAVYNDPIAAEAIITRFAKFSDAEMADALQTLASRPSYALALLDAVEAGRIDRRDVPTGVAVQLVGLKNKEVDERLAKVWGTVRPTSAARKQQAERLKQVLAPAAVAAADAKHGRELFTKNCAACHKLFGEGGKIGPELTGSQRANVDYVLENVLDPSAKVGRLYQVTVLELADGRVVQGVISEENDLSLTVQTANEQLTIAKGDIDARQQTSLSLMPDGLFDKLSDEEIRDLMAYLASNIQ